MHTSRWVWHRETDEAHVRDDNARLRAVLGHCPTGIAVLDENGNLVGYNEQFKSLFSAPPPLGEPVAQLFEEGPRAMLAEVVALAGTKQRAGAIISMQATANEEHAIEFLVGTLPGDATRSIGVVMAANDRTERIREEGDRSLLAREIGDANCERAINLAQSAMCHDMNNVLATIMLTLESLRKRCGTVDPEISTMLRELDEASKHGRELVARAKSRPQDTASRREVAEVRTCVERAAQVVAPLARSAKVTLSIRGPLRRPRPARRYGAHTSADESLDELRSRHPRRAAAGSNRRQGRMHYTRGGHALRARQRHRHRAIPARQQLRGLPDHARHARWDGARARDRARDHRRGGGAHRRHQHAGLRHGDAHGAPARAR